MKKETQLKLKKLIERIIFEESFKGPLPQDNIRKRVNIKYIPITKRAYTTQETGIEFQVIINGISATGFWRPSRGRYVSNGVDVNELTTQDRTRIRIYSGGGSYRSYEISASLPESPKQPKDLRWTGPILSLDNLKNEFISKIKRSLENPESEPKLTPEFLKYFGYA